MGDDNRMIDDASPAPYTQDPPPCLTDLVLFSVWAFVGGAIFETLSPLVPIFVVQRMANIFALDPQIPTHRLSYAGAKDRRAVTAQKVRCWRLPVSKG